MKLVTRMTSDMSISPALRPLRTSRQFRQTILPMDTKHDIRHKNSSVVVMFNVPPKPNVTNNVNVQKTLIAAELDER